MQTVHSPNVNRGTPLHTSVSSPNNLSTPSLNPHAHTMPEVASTYHLSKIDTLVKASKNETVKEVVEQLFSDIPKSASFAMETVIQKHQQSLQQILEARKNSECNWTDVPKEQMEEKINQAFDSYTEKLRHTLKDIKNFNTSDILTLFDKDGDLRKFCLKYFNDDPTKTLMFDLDCFIGLVDNALGVEKITALNVFPPTRNHKKYNACLGGMGNTLQDAILSLSKENIVTLYQKNMIKQCIESFIFKNKILDKVRKGHHIHVPYYFLSHLYPFHLIKQIDYAFLSPGSEISACNIHKFLSELLGNVEEQSQDFIVGLKNNLVTEIFSNSADGFEIIQEIKKVGIDNVDYNKLDNFAVFQKLDIKVQDFIAGFIDEVDNDYQFDESKLSQKIYQLSLAKAKNIKDLLKINIIEGQRIITNKPEFFQIKNLDFPHDEELKNQSVLEQFIQKIYVNLHDKDYIFVIRLLQKMGINSANQSRFTQGKEAFLTIKKFIPNDRPDLLHQFDRVQQRVDWMQGNVESGLKYYIEKDHVPLKNLFLFGPFPSIEEIKHSLEKELARSLNYKIDFAINKLSYQDNNVEILKIILPHCTDEIKTTFLNSLLKSYAEYLTAPLDETEIKDKIELLGIVLDDNAELALKNHNSNKPFLLRAIELNEYELVNKIFSKMTDEQLNLMANFRDRQRQTILHYAVKSKSLNMIHLIKEKFTDLRMQRILGIKSKQNGNTVLHDAAALGRNDICKLLLDLDPTSNKKLLQIKNRQGHRAVSLALINGKQILFEDILKYMFDNKIILNNYHKKYLVKKALKQENKFLASEINEYPSNNLFMTGIKRFLK